MITKRSLIVRLPTLWRLILSRPSPGCIILGSRLERLVPSVQIIAV